MPLSRLAVLLLIVPLTGCLQTQVKRIGSGYYQLQSAYQNREELEAVLQDHARKADELCPQGWRKRKDFDRRDGSSRLLVWEIACDGPYQPDNSQDRMGITLAPPGQSATFSAQG